MTIDECDRMTYEAMVDVKAGRLTDHQIVHTWAERLDADNPLPAPTPKKAAQEAASSKSNI